ncbi:MAG: hybrid sensor histidine kinase/response regulator [Gammaproteobacteria bacterium]
MSDKLNLAMLELFRLEAGSQLSVLGPGLAALQGAPEDPVEIESALRAFGALKAAARIATVTPIFLLAKQIEAHLSQTLQGKAELRPPVIEALQHSRRWVADFITAIDHEPQDWLDRHAEQFAQLELVFSADPPTQANTEEHAKGGAGDAEPEQPRTTTARADDLAGDNTAGDNPTSLADLSMLELFRLEAEEQTRILSDSLVALETHSDDARHLEQLMRSAHSLKGAARMVGLEAAVQIAHRAEDIFVAAQQASLQLEAEDMDLLLLCIDTLQHIAKATRDDYPAWQQQYAQDIDQIVSALNACLQRTPYTLPQPAFANRSAKPEQDTSGTEERPAMAAADAGTPAPTEENVVRVSGKTLNRLLGLAGEAQVAARWMTPFNSHMLQIKRRQAELGTLLDQIRDHLFDLQADDRLHELLNEARQKSNTCRGLLAERMTELDAYDRHSSSLAYRLNREILATRMRPFAEGIQGFQRLVRDVARSLDKDIKLDIRGLATQVDRDILDKLQAPLNHMIRNAIDHGIETAPQRLAAGKPAQGTIRLEAMHSAGMLSIIVQDDGAGIDQAALRAKVVSKGMVTASMAEKLTESELLDFLFLPNFSTRDTVSEISGRGVGLDVVHNVIQELRGQIRASSTLGEGLRFQLLLPLTLSVVRVLLVEIGAEIYAFPLGRIDQTLKLPQAHIETMEGRQYFTYGDRHIGIISAQQILQTHTEQSCGDEIPVVIIGDKNHQYGIAVDRLLGERNLIVHPIDPRLGKIQDISAASITEDGAPLLIFDVEDLLRSIDLLLSGGRINKLEQQQTTSVNDAAKRILVVDDSITVREVERNLLNSKGYQVETAVDGADGWNAARSKHYDLIISDIDMPRMNGFELVGLLKNDSRLHAIPVIIVSYKDREEDRQRGMEVGADYYLPKGSFHDDTLVEAVMDLIGPA